MSYSAIPVNHYENLYISIGINICIYIFGCKGRGYLVTRQRDICNMDRWSTNSTTLVNELKSKPVEGGEIELESWRLGPSTWLFIKWDYESNKPCGVAESVGSYSAYSNEMTNNRMRMIFRLSGNNPN